jgi:regulatory protein
MKRNPSLTREQALQKARHYCGWQERCHSEVREKLYSFGLKKGDVEEAVSALIEENYLNEERFAIQFAGGHFRMKGWGRVRIRYELKQKKVGEYCINKALAAIDENDYGRTLEKLGREKWDALVAGEDAFVRRHKLQEYLLRKGYETERVSALVRTIAV